MSEFNDPAFPADEWGGDEESPKFLGMHSGITIRQFFVAKAMQSDAAFHIALKAFGAELPWLAEDRDIQAFTRELAEAALDLADACLKAERESRDE